MGETFFEYMTIWKGKTRMVNRPNEKDQINMIIKIFFCHIIVGSCHRLLVLLGSFMIMELGLKIPLIMGNWRKVKASLLSRRHMEEERPLLKHPIP